MDMKENTKNSLRKDNFKRYQSKFARILYDLEGELLRSFLIFLYMKDSRKIHISTLKLIKQNA